MPARIYAHFVIGTASGRFVAKAPMPVPSTFALADVGFVLLVALVRRRCRWRNPQPTLYLGVHSKSVLGPRLDGFLLPSIPGNSSKDFQVFRLARRQSVPTTLA
jgi:hypothetical protein